MPRQPLPSLRAELTAARREDGRSVAPARARTRRRRPHLLRARAATALDRPVSAERAFASAAAIAPNDPEALAAAAVGRFSKDNPARAFAQLGPLVKRFPDAAVIRFHLGYLLVWIGERKQAAKELKLAQADAPGSVYARYSTTLLAALGAWDQIGEI